MTSRSFPQACSVLHCLALPCTSFDVRGQHSGHSRIDASRLAFTRVPSLPPISPCVRPLIRHAGPGGQTIQARFSLLFASVLRRAVVNSCGTEIYRLTEISRTANGRDAP